MKDYAEKVRQAPTTHIAAFLVLHEISAIVPLAAIWGGLYYLDYVPMVPESALEQSSAFIRKLSDRYSWLPESSPKFIAQGVVAYAVVKMLVPLRLFLSFAAAPWLAAKYSALIRVFTSNKTRAS